MKILAWKENPNRWNSLRPAARSGVRRKERFERGERNRGSEANPLDRAPGAPDPAPLPAPPRGDHEPFDLRLSEERRRWPSGSAGAPGEPGEAPRKRKGEGMALTPRVVETAVAGVVAAGLGLGGFTASTVELATALSAVSLAGLVVLLVAEWWSRRRWTIR
ncbi:MAG: hypothetical protein ACT4PM_11035 [Gemmatimonadales bacterium]